MPRSNQQIVANLLELADPVVRGAGYELVDVQYRREQTGWIVRVFIDGPGGISFSDCERVSRELGPVLDVHDPIPHAYTLEVSSPGIDRPLRTPEHFRRFIGHEARVELERGVEEYGGRKRYKGTLVAVSDDDSMLVMNVDGQEYRLPFGDIGSAKLVPNWDELQR